MPRKRAPTPEVRRFYRVFPWLPEAPTRATGHPLGVPQVQGAGRVDNPDHYRILYVSDAPAGAVAEAFGNHIIWSDGLLRGRPGLPGSTTALAVYSAPGLGVVDLDDPRALLRRRLKPSEVVTRDRAVSQAWALRIFHEGRASGVRWWSRYDSAWGSYGLWDTKRITVREVGALTRDHPAVVEARRILGRSWRAPRALPRT